MLTRGSLRICLPFVREPQFQKNKKENSMKNILLSMAALLTIGGAALADDAVLGTSATVKVDKATSKVLDRVYVGGNYNRNTEKTDVAVVYPVDHVRVRVLGVGLNPVAGVNFGRTPKDLGLTAGVVLPVAKVNGTEFNVGAMWVVPTSGWVAEPNMRVGLFARR